MKFPFRFKDICGGCFISLSVFVFVVNLTVECRLIGYSGSLGDGCDWTGR